MHERRDDLARTLTLDQGKPLHTEAYDEVGELEEYFRMGAADATPIEGLMPPSVDAGKRVLPHPTRCRRCGDTVELALHHARGAPRARSCRREHGG